MEQDRIQTLLGGCFNGEPASCSYACPFRVELRSFLKKAAKGRWDAAYKELQTAIPFPAVAAALCAGPCEDACQARTVLGGDPVSVRRIEAAVCEYAKRKAGAAYAIPEKPDRVAVVGAGPCGLSCALMLAQKKYQVTVYDRSDGWGGSLRTHASFDAFDTDFRLQFAPLKTEFVFSREIGSLTELTDFDAVLLATGAGGESWGLLEGRDAGLSSTSDPRVFIAGEVTGAPLMEGMAEAARAARSIESFLQTGSAASAAEVWDRGLACRFAPHPCETPSGAVVPSGAVYTQEEAKAEAARCLQCDCGACMNACELMEKYRKRPPRIATDVQQDGQSRNSVSSASITRQTWSCNLCSRCALLCPEDTDIAGLFQYSREGRVAANLYPPALHAYWLRELEEVERARAAIPGNGAVFFPGCRLSALSPELVKKTYALLQDKLGAGIIADCCGIPAWWAGEKDRFERHIDALRETWTALGKPVFITACLSCEKILARFLPEIELRSLYAVLRELGVTGSDMGLAAAAVFDPCASAEKPEVKEAVRALAAVSGVSVSEYDNGGKCCGNGGHMRLADPALYGSIVSNRSGEREEPYIVYCANCWDTFREAGKDCRHILELLTGVDAGSPTLEEKRKNILKLKEALTGDAPTADPWDRIAVTAPEEVLRKMDALLIPAGDVRRALYEAERDSAGFVDADGRLLVSLDLGSTVIWVLCVQEDGGYRLMDVYSHRMHVREEG